jgi:hypothetical protein
MAMNSISGEVSQPMRNRGLEISILPSAFTRADAVQVALAAGVSLRDTTKLLSDDCDIRRANFVAETARALGGSGCCLEETLELIKELHPPLIVQPNDASGNAHAVVTNDISHVQQPSLRAWLNHPHQSNFLRICCSVASIAQHFNVVSANNLHMSLPPIESPPSLLAAACSLALCVSSQDRDDIGRVLNMLPPNSFLEFVSLGVTHLRDQNFNESEDLGSFDLLLGYLGISSASHRDQDESTKGCNTATLRMWFSLVLVMDSVFMQKQGTYDTHSIAAFLFSTHEPRFELD